MPETEPKLPERSRRKREDIIAAATELFLEKGYASTTMEEVATEAGVSKQTVYKNFGDKESLFREIVMSTITDVSNPFQTVIEELIGADDVPSALRELGCRYIKAVISPELLRRRQLVVREAGRLPDLARSYYEAAPRQNLVHLADAFAKLGDRGELAVDAPEVAATHFAFLILGQPLDTVMFTGYDTPWSDAELTAMADAGTDAFLRAYGPDSRT